MKNGETATLRLVLRPGQRVLVGENEVEFRVENLSHLEYQAVVVSLRPPPELTVLDEPRFRIPLLEPNATSTMKARLYASRAGSFSLDAVMDFREGSRGHKVRQTLHVDVRPPAVSRVFISHAHRDKAFVERLATDLRQAGLEVWYDAWEIKVGESIVQKINAGLQRSDYLIIILSPESVVSPWVQQELSAALMTLLSDQNIVVLPVLYRDCQIPPLLRDRRYADFRTDYQAGLRSLLEVFGQESVVVSVPAIPPTWPCRLYQMTQAELRRVLNERLTLDEVKAACFDLEVDYENLAGDTKNEKIIELLLHLNRRGRLPDLMAWLVDSRPDLC